MKPSVLQISSFIRWSLCPVKCVVCGVIEFGADNGALCHNCENKIEFPPNNICSVCGKPLDFEYEIETGELYKCGECTLKPPMYNQFRFAMVYGGPVRELIHKLKFQSQRRLAKPLAQFAYYRLVPWFTQWPDAVIIPVPLAPGRLFTRGYNPPYLIAKILGRGAGLTVAEGAIKRTRATAPQFGLNGKQREKNVKGAFAVHDRKSIEGRDIILFDDIHTTGATIRECCRTIKKARPANIMAAALCRA